MDKYLALRDELATYLKDFQGVVSVGIGRSGRDIGLVVVVDREKFRGEVPAQFKGVNVRILDLGTGIMHRSRFEELECNGN